MKRYDDLYFEDIKPGAVFETGAITLTAEDIIRFGKEWDDRPFHVDAELAKSSIFGELIASGFHTLLATFRLCSEANLFGATALAGLGLEKIRFLRPVPPGATIRALVEVESTRPSPTRPDAGIVAWRIKTLDERGRIVMTATLHNLVKRKASS